MIVRHTLQDNADGEIAAMESLRDVVDNQGIPLGKCFPFTKEYLTYETNKVHIKFNKYSCHLRKFTTEIDCITNWLILNN